LINNEWTTNTIITHLLKTDMMNIDDDESIVTEVLF